MNEGSFLDVNAPPPPPHHMSFHTVSIPMSKRVVGNSKGEGGCKKPKLECPER